MKYGTTSILRITLAALLAFAPITAAVAKAASGEEATMQQERQASMRALTVPISGTIGPEGAPNPATLSGSFTIKRFAQAGTSIVAVGTLTATYTDPATSEVRTVTTQAALPVSRQAAAPQPVSDVVESDARDHGPAVETLQPACDILHLVLGPLDLDLLGLEVHLDQVVLDITAVPGAGNLLGNLLCAITGLLDGTGGQLAQLISLLNQLLDLLG